MAVIGLRHESERVEASEEIVPAIARAKQSLAEGRPALLEMITKEETTFAQYW